VSAPAIQHSEYEQALYRIAIETKDDPEAYCPTAWSLGEGALQDQ
jgi:hypothetical protein